MAVSTYSTAALVRVVRDLKTPTPGFLLGTFFPGIIEYTTEEIAIDVIVGKRRIAPFCSPLVQGKLVQGQGFTTSTFKPAYIKDKRVPDVRRPIKRMAGERLGGDMSPADREAANIAFEMEDQIRMIDRRLEWMAASALSGGTITVTGDGFPTTVVDFGRTSGLTVNLTLTDRWGESGNNNKPSADIETWATLMLKESGAAPTDIVFTPTSWKWFKADSLVKDSIDTTLRGGESAIELGGGQVNGGRYMGRWGLYRLWLYQDWYVDPADDTEKPMLADGTVILGSAAIEGTRSFGAIMDPAFNYGALAYAPKMWLEEDPAQRVLLMQSAPLVIPTRVNASFAAQVRGS